MAADAATQRTNDESTETRTTATQRTNESTETPAAPRTTATRRTNEGIETRATARAARAARAAETLRLIVDGGHGADAARRAELFAAGAAVARPVATAPVATQFSVVAASTLVACRDFPDACALVFASAKHAGGGFLKGAEAQEECVARGSALHAALTASQCRGFYIRHKTKGLYTDAVIYARDVPLFRDERDALLEEPFPRCSFAVAAAPNAGVARRDGVADAEIKEVLRARISRVLTVARVRGHRDVILGAFGCGVFRNDPEVVAAAFADALAAEHRGAFRNVIFAIKGGPPANLAAFRARFRT